MIIFQKNECDKTSGFRVWMWFKLFWSFDSKNTLSFEILVFYFDIGVGLKPNKNVPFFCHTHSHTFAKLKEQHPPDQLIFPHCFISPLLINNNKWWNGENSVADAQKSELSILSPFFRHKDRNDLEGHFLCRSVKTAFSLASSKLQMWLHIPASRIPAEKNWN